MCVCVSVVAGTLSILSFRTQCGVRIRMKVRLALGSRFKIRELFVVRVWLRGSGMFYICETCSPNTKCVCSRNMCEKQTEIQPFASFSYTPACLCVCVHVGERERVCVCVLPL